MADWIVDRNHATASVFYCALYCRLHSLQLLLCSYHRSISPTIFTEPGRQLIPHQALSGKTEVRKNRNGNITCYNCCGNFIFLYVLQTIIGILSTKLRLNHYGLKVS